MSIVDDKQLDANTSFEQVLEGLEEVVKKLEGGELSLEASLSAFEEGVRLSRMGSERLDAAERRVEELLADGSAAPIRGAASAASANVKEAL